jgi:hypothetical protein
MYGGHQTSNNEQPRDTNASRFSPPPLLRHQCYFISFIDVHLRLGKSVFGTIILNDLGPEEGE